MSEILAEFYQVYWDTINHKIKPSWYQSDAGLCHNLEAWLEDQGYDELDGYDIRLELEEQFEDAGLDTEYPFNGDWLNYRTERDNCTMADNIKRRLWVLSKLEEIKNDSE